LKSLKNKIDFDALYKKGIKRKIPIGTAINTPGEELKLGIVINRTIGNAVKRNRIKRIIRETVRKHSVKASIVLIINRKDINTNEISHIINNYFNIINNDKQSNN